MNAPIRSSDAVARAEVAIGSVATLMERLAEGIGGKATVKAVFGEPIVCEGMTIIPVAKVGFGFGGGAGGGGDTSVTDNKSGGGGGGGAGGVDARALGYIAVHNGVATYSPIRNATFDNVVTVLALIAGMIAPKVAKAAIARLRK